MLTANASTANACQTAGGTFVGRLAILEKSVDQPSAGLDGALATLRVCSASVTITIAGIGVESFPAYTLC